MLLQSPAARVLQAVALSVLLGESPRAGVTVSGSKELWKLSKPASTPQLQSRRCLQSWLCPTELSVERP